MEELIVLDYSLSEAYFYRVDPDTDIDEEYIIKLGHNPDECNWMFGENIYLVKHEELLK